MTTQRFTVAQALAFAERACVGAGANEAAARSLAEATVSAETWGRSSVGFSHLPDYLVGLRDGSIDGHAEPIVSSPAPALVSVDARGGIGQLGFDLAEARLKDRARSLGVAILAQRNSFTVGELGYYVRRLAQDGLVALAATNSHALLTPPGARVPLYGTNPLAFGAPAGGGELLVIDQSSSQTALVNVRDAAARGDPLPAGWALDEGGSPTTDPVAALSGSLTPFGDGRGANLALIVEVLAAGLTGAEWSMDSRSGSGTACGSNAGLFVLAINPGAPDRPFADRLRFQLARLRELGAYVPGWGKRATPRRDACEGLDLPDELVERIGFLGGL